MSIRLSQSLLYMPGSNSRALEQATEQGKGIIVVAGRLVEELHVNEARHILALAQSIAEMEHA